MVVLSPMRLLQTREEMLTAAFLAGPASEIMIIQYNIKKKLMISARNQMKEKTLLWDSEDNISSSLTK